MKATAPARKTTTTLEKTPAADPSECCHHWLLGQPMAGAVSAVCRKCGAKRDYPAVLDDLDPPAELETKAAPVVEGAATAVGGARPSPVASR